MILALVTALALSQTSYGPCNTQAQCHPNIACNAGTCADAVGSSCTQSSHCGPGGACYAGKCSQAPDGTCTQDAECAGRGKCQNKKCVN